MVTYPDNRGFTLLELIVAMSIFALFATATAWLLITGIRSNSIIWDQLSTQSDGRRVLREVVDDVRRAESSSIGSYPIVTAGEYELTFYSNIDSDTERERVRFWLDNTVLKKGTIHPTGLPLSYPTSSEEVVTIANFVVNEQKNTPLFTYFDETYTGTSTPLAQPVNVTNVNVVHVELQLEENPDETPVPLNVQTTVHIRNLKTN